MRIHENFCGAKNLVRGADSLAVVDVDEMMLGLLAEYQQAKDAIMRRLRALFVAADVQGNGEISYKYFQSIVRAADPSFPSTK